MYRRAGIGLCGAGGPQHERYRVAGPGVGGSRIAAKVAYLIAGPNSWTQSKGPRSNDPIRGAAGLAALVLPSSATAGWLHHGCLWVSA